MIVVIIDSNIYNCLSTDTHMITAIREKIKTGKIKILVTRTIAEELWKSPFKGIPKFFPIEFCGNTVARCGIMRCGDTIGSGKIFDAHRGKSKKINDALIADVADSRAQWLISEDRRLRTRMRQISKRCRVLDYISFKGELLTLT